LLVIRTAATGKSQEVPKLRNLRPPPYKFSRTRNPWSSSHHFTLYASNLCNWNRVFK